MNEGCGRKIVPHLTVVPSRGREYYQCCTIINDDHRDHLWRFNPKSFDLIVADPPYGQNIKGWQKHHKDPGWDHSFPAAELTALLGLARLGSYIFCRWENLWDSDARAPAFEPGYFGNIGEKFQVATELGVRLDEVVTMGRSDMYPTHTLPRLPPRSKGSLAARLEGGVVVNNLPKPKCVLVWHKLGSGAGLGGQHGHHRDFETVLFYPGPEHHWGKKKPTSVLTYKAPGNNIHVTQKPPDLIKEILGWYELGETGTVLDPYMGSGTTAVVAKRLKKHFLGFEADKENWRKAVQRIADLDKARTK